MLALASFAQFAPMTRLHMYSDEAGCFVFSRNERASRYFIVCTVCLPDLSIGDGLLRLRRDLVWRKLPVKEEFHACEDANVIREAVYDFLQTQKFRIDATLLEKSKAAPALRASPEIFYGHAWHHHFRCIKDAVLRDKEELAITAAALGTKRGQAVYTNAVNAVLQQLVQRQQWSTFFPRAIAEPCLQIADYCAWAVQRKWERADHRWYSLIAEKIQLEHDLWRERSQHYY